jgi:hypothetical protein
MIHGDRIMTLAATIRSAVAFILLCAPAVAQNVLAPAPPMGWNSWDSFGTGVTEAEVKANADYMAKNLAAHGWQYVVVDIQWSEANPKSHGYRPDTALVMDGNGRLMPAPNRFPSAADGKGFKPLADYVHSKGLKFGIHIMRGIPRRAVDRDLPIAGSAHKASEIADKNSICPWNSDMYGVDVAKTGGQDYYDSIARLYAEWGLDFIKADDMFGPGEGGDHSSEIAALSTALGKTGRPIVLSLSPGTGDADKAAFIGKYAQMWRISDDFWDRWVDLKRQFPNFTKWNPYVNAGNWPDGDMLPLGHIGIRAERGDPRMSLLTHDEQRTLMTLWSIARSPLMFGGNLPDNDQWTLDLITNDEVLAVNQKAVSSRELFTRGNQVAWIAELPGSTAKYLAIFNIGDAQGEDIKVNWSDLGLPANCSVRDLWAKKDVGSKEIGQTFRIAPHASALYRITPAGGKTLVDYFLPMPVRGRLTKDAWGAGNVLPRDPENGLEDLSIRQWCYWDGQIIKGPDHKYHMFASRWDQSRGHRGWVGSQAVHAVSDNPMGPYKDQGLTWPGNQGGKGHNVTALVLPDKRYAVVVSETRPGDVFVSKSLDGPWEQLGSIKTDPNGFNPRDARMSNVSVMLRPDGKFEIVARSGAIMISSDGILGPYKLQGPSIYAGMPGLPLRNLEDPVIWYSGGMYHIVVNCWSERKAFHLTSPDGISNWKNRGLAYDPTTDFVRYKDGTLNHWDKMERPSVLIENGHVAYFTFAVLDVPKDQEKGNDNHGSKIVVIPFDGAALDRDMRKLVDSEAR